MQSLVDIMREYYKALVENYQQISKKKQMKDKVEDTKADIQNLEKLIVKSNEEIDSLTEQLPDLEFQKKDNIKNKKFGMAN